MYLGFAEPGDQYLGRLLAGLLPNSAEFAVIPPHFLCGMENKYLAEAMNLCFRGIIDNAGRNINGVVSLRANTKALLLRCLASMVHHSESLLKAVDADPIHCFASIPIFTNFSLLCELKKLLTSEPSDRIMMATGIPPHVEAMSKIEDLTNLIRQERDDRLVHYENVKIAIVDKIKEVSEANGQITCPSVIIMFDEFGTKFESAISSKIDEVLCAIQNSNRGGRIEDGVDVNIDAERAIIVNRGPKGHIWTYRGRFWSVPEKFELPKKVQSRRAWELWIRGMDTPDGKRICSFRNFTSASVPKDVYKKLKLEWQPIMKKMENSPGVQIPASSINVNQF